MAVIALGILCSGRFEVRMTAGVTHIGHHLALNIHNELAKVPGVGGGTYREAPIASSLS